MRSSYLKLHLNRSIGYYPVTCNTISNEIHLHLFILQCIHLTYAASHPHVMNVSMHQRPIPIDSTLQQQQQKKEKKRILQTCQ